MTVLKIDAFVNHLLVQDRAETTISSYRRNLAAFVTWYEQTVGREPEPAAITPQDIRTYRQELISVKQMKPASVNRRLVALRVYFNWTCEIGLIPKSPLDGMKDLRQVPRAPRWLTRDETGALLHATAEVIKSAQARALTSSVKLAQRDATILVLLLNIGLRVSELCALRLTDIKINDQSGWLIVRSGKGRKYREVPLNYDARRALRKWLAVRPLEAGEALFVSRRGTALHPRSVQRRMKRLAVAAQLDAVAVTPHALRHSLGKNLVDADVSLDRVALLLGHESLATTAIYTIPSRADLTTAVERITQKAT